MTVEYLLSQGWIPDALIRYGIRRRLDEKLRQERSVPDRLGRKQELVRELERSSIALHTQEANKQHYELPPEFFEAVLGKYLKYSCGYWDDGCLSLNASESRMLDFYIERARIRDGQQVLDLGCGWGSFSLYLAERYPRCRILAVSNSRLQKEFIDRRIQVQGLTNLRVVTCDVNQLEFEERFDRVVSVEMLEHVRNYKNLFSRIGSWIKDDGFVFVHIFCHREFAYPFMHAGKKDWMGRHFFTGGVMPSFDLFSYFQETLSIEQTWRIDGRHYEKTCNAWLRKMDYQKAALMPVFECAYGKGAVQWWNYWRVFFMACAELFGYAKGAEWFVGHYLFRKKHA